MFLHLNLNAIYFDAIHKKKYLCLRLKARIERVDQVAWQVGFTGLSGFPETQMVVVAQLVRALDCGSRGRRVKSG